MTVSTREVHDSREYLDSIRPMYGRIQVAAYMGRVLGPANPVFEPVLFERVSERGGFWQGITGGAEEYDDTLIDAIRREIIEETGLEIARERLIPLPSNVFQFKTESTGKHIEHSFALAITPDELGIMEVNVGEHTAFSVGSLETQIKRLKFEENQRALTVAAQVVALSIAKGN